LQTRRIATSGKITAFHENHGFRDFRDCLFVYSLHTHCSEVRRWTF